MLDQVTLVIFTGLDRRPTELGERERVEYMLPNLAEPFRSVILTGANANAYRDLGAEVVEIRGAEAGPLATLQGALSNSRTVWNFCVSSSIPLLTPRVAAVLCEHCGDFPGIQAVVPRVKGGLLPLCALYATSCSEAVSQAVRAGGTSVLDVLATVRLTLVDEACFNHQSGSPAFFLNVHNRKDLELVRSRLRQCPA
ncbi:MAG: NTP transferase domain-containing protein [Planctomycetota bacterium]